MALYQFNLLSVQMMRPRMTLQEIYQYLIQKNYNLASDRTLKEPAANPDIIWNIIVFLTLNLRDTKFDQIQPTLSYLLDSQNHKNSLKRIKQYTIVGDVFKKIYNNHDQYPIKQILRPQKQFIFEKISSLICANKYWQKITKQYEPLRTEIKLKRLQVQQLRRKLQCRTQQIQEMKAIKQKQRPYYEEKLQSIQNLSKDLNYKKKQKLDLLNSQQLLDSEHKKKVKFANQLGYTIDDLNIKIKQLERQVIRNAPKLKKERFALIQKFEQMIKNNKEQFDVWMTKIQCFNDKLKICQFVKEKSKTFKIQKKFKQIQNLSHQINIVSNKLNQNNESKKQSINTKKKLLKSIQQMEKNKKQLAQSIGQEQKQLVLLRKSLGMLKEEQKVNQKNVRILQQKNALSINQYVSLNDKIKNRRQKMKQKIFQLNYRLKNMQAQSKRIIQETFSEFN